MPLSESDRERIRPYVSNLDGSVFALAGLPEEVIAVLFAYYSRTRDDLRTNLARLLADHELSVTSGAEPAGQFRLATDKARTFHEKWVVGYGHASVAEHAVIHLAIEDVSIVVTKAIEDLRLGSYTEKSTRYVQWDEGSFRDLPHLSEAAQRIYRDAASTLFRTYLALVPDVEREVARRVTQGEKQQDAAYRTAVRAKTFDLLRGLLPAGTRTNLGVTANARAIELLLSKMLASPLAEARDVARSMHREAASIAPTLVKYVSENEYRRSLREATAAALVGAGIAAPLSVARRERPSGVHLLHWDEDATSRILVALAIESDAGALDVAELRRRVDALPEQERCRLVRESLDRRGRFDPAPRAFEAATLSCEVITDFGAYRDLQRHRMLSPFTQRLGCQLGAEIPSELEELGVRAPFEAALAQAETAWKSLVETHPWDAQYIVPLAYRVRTMWQLNVRELFHVVELRSAKQGHASYRAIAQQLYGEAVAKMPWLDGVIRVDANSYALARA